MPHKAMEKQDEKYTVPALRRQMCQSPHLGSSSGPGGRRSGGLKEDCEINGGKRQCLILLLK